MWNRICVVWNLEGYSSLHDGTKSRRAARDHASPLYLTGTQGNFLSSWSQFYFYITQRVPSMRSYLGISSCVTAWGNQLSMYKSLWEGRPKLQFFPHLPSLPVPLFAQTPLQTVTKPDAFATRHASITHSSW